MYVTCRGSYIMIYVFGIVCIKT